MQRTKKDIFRSRIWILCVANMVDANIWIKPDLKFEKLNVKNPGSGHLRITKSRVKPTKVWVEKTITTYSRFWRFFPLQMHRFTKQTFSEFWLIYSILFSSATFPLKCILSWSCLKLRSIHIYIVGFEPWTFFFMQKSFFAMFWGIYKYSNLTL